MTGDGDGVVLALEVSPASGKAGFITGYDPWRKTLRCAVRSPPEKGRANREVMESLAQLLGVPVASVEIVSGSLQGRKRVKVTGIARDRVLEALGRLL